MKTTFKHSAFLMALFAALSFATVTKANDEKNQDVKAPVEFKYLGKMDNQPVFQLKLNSSQLDEYVVKFRDNYGYVFYSAVAKNNTSQKFVLNVDELEGNTIVVQVTSKKTKKSETFTIQTNQRVIDETVVAKLD
jgi:hypothetical protein